MTVSDRIALEDNTLSTISLQSVIILGKFPIRGRGTQQMGILHACPDKKQYNKPTSEFVLQYKLCLQTDLVPGPGTCKSYKSEMPIDANQIGFNPDAPSSWDWQIGPVDLVFQNLQIFCPKWMDPATDVPAS